MPFPRKAAAPGTQDPSASTPAGASAPVKIEAFYKKEKDRVIVSLWIVDPKAAGAPDFDGTIDGQVVNVRIRNGVNGAFMAINKRVDTGETNADGKPVFHEEQLGTANLVVNSNGMPRMVIKLNANKAEPVWASISKKVPDELLARAGLNFKTMAERRAAKAAIAPAAQPA
jgi:hypothetical protein